MTIDSVYGLAIHSGKNGDAEILNSKVYGDYELNEDCPEGSVCDHCFDTTGIVSNQACDSFHLDY